MSEYHRGNNPETTRNKASASFQQLLNDLRPTQSLRFTCHTTRVSSVFEKQHRDANLLEITGMHIQQAKVRPSSLDYGLA